MPYWTDLKFQSLIERALAEPSVQTALDETGIGEEGMTRLLTEKQSEIQNAASGIVQDYESIEQTLDEARQELDLALPEPKWRARHDPFLHRILAFVGLVIAVVWTLVLWYMNDWSYSAAIDSTSMVVKVIIAGLALVPLLVLSYSQFCIFRHARYDRLKERWKVQIDEAREHRGINDLRGKMENAGERIDSHVLQTDINERVRSIINRWTEASYSSEFAILSATGLAEVIDPGRTVDTDSRVRLRTMLESMPGGSIGIAGPRGSGKSTLIYTYCSPNRSVKDINGRRIIPILTSAPVVYEAREFVLHLFSAACQSVLDMLGVKLGGSPPQRPEPHRPKLSLSVVRSLSLIITLIGTSLVAFGLFWAAFIIEAPGGAPNTLDGPNKSAVTPAEADKDGSESGNGTLDLRAILKALDLSAGTMVTVGVMLATFSVAFWLWRVLDSRRRRWDERERDVGRDRGSPQRQMENLRYDLEEPLKKLAINSGHAAIEWLQDIRFQQSFTSGWSGALKIPMGLEGKLNEAVTLAQKQLSQPDIISAFRRFLESIPDTFQIVIGIDELDKIENDGDATTFLNEIKSVFGIPRCFYLISVSESAMSSFERRGLPFRDVFDSSFDSILRVGYLTFEMAQELLSRRVIGKPIQFMCLCYCLSGGLARDLIRAFRRVVELNKIDPSRKNMSSLCTALLGEEVRAKARATVVATRKLNASEKKNNLMRILYQMREIELTPQSLTTALEDLNQSVCKTPPSPDQKINGAVSNDLKIVDLAREVIGYCYFTLTLLEIFDSELTVDGVDSLIKNGTLSDLAKSRQAMSVDRRIAISIVNDVRAHRGLDVLPLQEQE